MPIDAAKLARMERELAEAKAQFLQEDGERYRILMREMSEVEKQRILDRLTDNHERRLFGLEVPEEGRRPGRKVPARVGGNEVCPYCSEGGFSKRGLALHKSRRHPEQYKRERARAAEAGAADEEA